MSTKHTNNWIDINPCKGKYNMSVYALNVLHMIALKRKQQTSGGLRVVLSYIHRRLHSMYVGMLPSKMRVVAYTRSVSESIAFLVTLREVRRFIQKASASA